MSKRAMVLETVQEHGPISAADVAMRLDLPKQQVSYYLTALKKKKVINSGKKGWVFTPGMATPKPNKLEPVAPKEPVPTSILLSLTIAREALDEAIKKVEQLEHLIYGVHSDE